jgi:hypothetical protein
LVYFNWTYWVAVASGNGNVPGRENPGLPSQWLEAPLFPLKQALNQRELRVSFFWPLLPNGKVGYGRQTYRTTIAGQLVAGTGSAGQVLYFYVPQTFLNTP